jgi:hypothetical protein
MYGDNIFSVMGEASMKLEAAGKRVEVRAMRDAVMTAQSYDDAYQIIEDAVAVLDTEAEADAEWDRYWAEADADNAAREG